MQLKTGLYFISTIATSPWGERWVQRNTMETKSFAPKPVAIQVNETGAAEVATLQTDPQPPPPTCTHRHCLSLVHPANTETVAVVHRADRRLQLLHPLCRLRRRRPCPDHRQGWQALRRHHRRPRHQLDPDRVRDLRGGRLHVGRSCICCHKGTNADYFSPPKASRMPRETSGRLLRVTTRTPRCVCNMDIFLQFLVDARA